MRANITSQHVARLAQVSQSAVSRTYTPGASVSIGTRARVMDAARQLGYRPNAIARSLITRRSRMIGVVMSQLDNQFYPLVLEKLSQRLRRDGYHVLLFITARDESDGVLAEILQYQVDGIIMASTVLSSALARASPMKTTRQVPSRLTTRPADAWRRGICMPVATSALPTLPGWRSPAPTWIASAAFGTSWRCWAHACIRAPSAITLLKVLNWLPDNCLVSAPTGQMRCL